MVLTPRKTQEFNIDPPDHSILGINYSGMHDSAIAIVSPTGIPVFAVSLERISRIKQDGRRLDKLLDLVPWNKIDKVAISSPEYLQEQKLTYSSLLTTFLPESRNPSSLAHGDSYLKAIRKIKSEIFYVGHQEAHASSAFWGSGFNNSLCLTYDGGMFNDNWFGGLFYCSKDGGIKSLDKFDARLYAKVSTLYSFVTALLGFNPLRHEGKITGLAAYGSVTERCMNLLTTWFEKNHFELENALQWFNMYGDNCSPRMIADPNKLQPFLCQIEGISKEELAASIQFFAENHILQILSKATSLGWTCGNICLAGGLFANVKINQKIVESGFTNLFIAPPMTDDGTALGAAWHICSHSDNFSPQTLRSMYLGPDYSKKQAREIVRHQSIIFNAPKNVEEEIADILTSGYTVAIFRGKSEFGPRSLGNRSILAQATEKNINITLNKMLQRSEFMPFAPISREEDALLCFQQIDSVRHSAEFMTVAVQCTDLLKSKCPAVVHIDGTARPQLVCKDINPFIHKILSIYNQKTGVPALINTSFNVHEEPIVCSVHDALRGFFTSGLDYLFIEGVGIISFSDNPNVAITYLQEKLRSSALNDRDTDNIVIGHLHFELTKLRQLFDKVSYDLIDRTQELIAIRGELIERTTMLEQVSLDLNKCTNCLSDTSTELSNRSNQLISATVLLDKFVFHFDALLGDLDKNSYFFKKHSEVLIREKTKVDDLKRSLDTIKSEYK